MVYLIFALTMCGIAFIFIGFSSYYQRQIKKAVIGKVEVIFIGQNRSRDIKLCSFQGNQIIDKDDNGNRFAYIIKPKKVWVGKYPSGPFIPEGWKVSLGSLIFARGNPEPLDPYEFFSDPALTDQTLANTADEQFSKLMLDKAGEEGRAASGKKSSLNTYLLVGLGASCLVSVICLILVFTMRGQIGTMSAQLNDVASILGAGR